MFRPRISEIARIVAIVVLVVAARRAHPQHRTEAFPLAKGSYWIYEGTRKSEDQAGQEITEKVSQKMQVINRVERGGIVAAVIRGYPNSDEKAVQVLIVVDDLAFYLLESDDSILKRLKDPNDALVDFVREDDLVLSLPLVKGKRFCEASEMTRPDGFYCWRVEEYRREKLKGITGLSADVERTIYTVAFRTLPDHTVVDFVPGVGITSYHYEHHGTVDETDLKLTEFHPAAVTSH